MKEQPRFKTEFVPVTQDTVTRAGQLIREGLTVAFPTETVYGLGANALDAEAVARIFEAKGRPGDNPLIVHICDARQLGDLIDGEPNAVARALMDAYWPGPMTLIFPKSGAVPLQVTAGLQTVAVRFPSHPAARALIEAAGVPIAAPSANLSGRPSPTTAADVYEDMDGRIPMILDGGACEVGLESTVIDVTGDVPRILRPGGVTPEMIRKVCGQVLVDEAVSRPLKPGEQPRSPGMKYRHYAPKASVVIVRGCRENVVSTISDMYDDHASHGENVLILALDDHVSAYGDRKVLSPGADATDMARSIFALLRNADHLDMDLVLTEAVSEEGMGLAVMNRLYRAAGFHIVNADQN